MLSKSRSLGLAMGLSMCAAVAMAMSVATAEAMPIKAAAACNQKEDHDLTLRGCSALIGHPDTDRQDLAAAYTLRARAYEEVGQLGLAFRDTGDALRANPELHQARAHQILLAATFNMRCNPWAAQEKARQAIEACSIIIANEPGFYRSIAIGRARVDRGLLLKAAGRANEAMEDFKAVADSLSGAAAGDVARAKEEINANRN